MWDKLSLLKSQGITMLLTTHYMDEAAYLCDRLVVMDAGKILAGGAPSDLIRDTVGSQVVEIKTRHADKPALMARLESARIGARVEDRADTILLYAGERRAAARRLRAGRFRGDAPPRQSGRRVPAPDRARAARGVVSNMANASLSAAVRRTPFWGGAKLWQRNRDAAARAWKVEIGGLFVEPFILLVAMGFGLGAYVDNIGERSYAQFVAPGVIAGYAMFHATFDATYGAYLRMESHHISRRCCSRRWSPATS